MKFRFCTLIATSTLFSLLHAQPAGPQPEPPKAECSISGQVLNAATGEPLKKASVSLTQLPGQQSSPVRKDVDASGRFVFENLEPGRYTLRAARDGFVRQSYGAKRAGSQIGSTLALQPGQNLKDLRIGMTPHGVISGRIVDEDGEPRSGFHVSAVQPRWTGNKREMLSVAFASTNDLGEYRMFGLPPGSYTIRAARQSEFSQAAAEPSSSLKPEDDYVPTYYPGTANSNTAAPVQVRSSIQMQGIDIKMLKARVVRVRGTVISGVTGKPVRASLMMASVDRSGGFHQGMVMDAKGSFEFRGVTAGEYRLATNASTQDGELSSHTTVVVADQPLTNLKIVVRPPVSISGRIIIEGEADDKDKDAATPLNVTLRPVEMDSFSGFEEAEIRNGAFTAKNVQPGRYRLGVTGIEGYLKSAVLGNEDVLENPLEIPDGGLSGELVLVVSRKSAEVSGSVRDEKENLKPGALALLLPEEKYRDQFQRIGIGPVDQHGAYQIKDLRPGKYSLLVLEDVDGFEWMDPEFIKPFEKSAISLTLEEGQKESRQLTVRSKPAEGQ